MNLFFPSAYWLLFKITCLCLLVKSLYVLLFPNLYVGKSPGGVLASPPEFPSLVPPATYGIAGCANYANTSKVALHCLQHDANNGGFELAVCLCYQIYIGWAIEEKQGEVSSRKVYGPSKPQTKMFGSSRRMWFRGRPHRPVSGQMSNNFEWRTHFCMSQNTFDFVLELVERQDEDEQA